MILLPLLLQTQSMGLLPQETLRREFPSIVIGIVLLATGIAVSELFIIRWKSRELSLFYFGLFCSLYAVRLLEQQVVIQALFDRSADFWLHVDWAITRLIMIPFTLYVLDVFGKKWRPLLLSLLYAQIALATAGELADILNRGKGPAQIANDVLVIASFVVILAVIIGTQFQGALTRDLVVLTVGYLAFALFVLHTNLVNLGVVDGPTMESAGFLIFAGSLGYVSLHRSLANERELLSVRRELDIARQIQSSILPANMPQIAGINIAARHVPMSAVAGDFYDFLLVDDSRIGIIVADVTGHGVPAALIASMVKVAFAAQFAYAAEPDRVLNGLNQALCGKFEEHFVTAAYIFVDTKARVIRYAGAGHPPLLAHSKSSGEIREISQNGLFLGCAPDATYSSVEIPIAAGDRFILCTDGVLECANRAYVEFGPARLKSSLEQHINASVSEFSDALLADLSRWAERRLGESHADDITFAVVDFTGAV